MSFNSGSYAMFSFFKSGALRFVLWPSVVIVFLAIPPLTQEVLAQPRLMVRGGLDFYLGNVYQGDQASFSTMIFNAGNQVLKIEDVNAFCACTKPSIGSRRIMPGDSARVSATYDSKHAAP